MRDRYLTVIDDLVSRTLKGQIASKAQIFDQLKTHIEIGTGELFERCLQERVSAIAQQLASETDELKQAKLTRSQRALNNIQTEWDHLQQTLVSQAHQSQAKQVLLNANPTEQLLTLLQLLDPNRDPPLNLSQILDLAKTLDPNLEMKPSPQSTGPSTPPPVAAPPASGGFGFSFGASNPPNRAANPIGFGFGAVAEPLAEPSVPSETSTPEPLQGSAALALGLQRGIQAWQRLEPDLLAWMYEQGRDLGFGGEATRGPWQSWAQRLSGWPSQLLTSLAQQQHITPDILAEVNLAQWVELAVLLQRIPQGLVAWFERQAYDPKAGPQAAIATYLTFAALWGQLWNGLQSPLPDRSLLADASFQMALQLLRHFAEKPYFPLYGGVYASLSGQYLQNALDYLDQPLRQVDNTQAKARILTLLGYTQQVLGNRDRARGFHQTALETAQAAGDLRCQIANLNHLSRTAALDQDYGTAIALAQRALVLARQSGGKRADEAHALTNLGYAEVYTAQQQEYTEPETYEQAVNHLQQGLQLAEREGDRASQALACNSLGQAQIQLGQAEAAVQTLQQGLGAMQSLGNLFLLGQTYGYLAEALRMAGQPEQAIAMGAIAMVLLEPIQAPDWKRAAGLLGVLRGEMGEAAFWQALQEQRAALLPIIGVEGFEGIAGQLDAYWRE
ncbi:MAG: hypothetical protein WCD18_20790 [Thermosynechococcaceae cyanobacterium]